jgi:hypothetical protein
MKDTSRYIPLNEIVNYYISEAQLTAASFLRLWHFAIRGLEDMAYSFSAEPVTRKLDVLPNKTVELPGDYVDWCKVGVLNENGEVATLRFNAALSGYASVDDERTSYNIDNTTGINSTSSDYFYRNYLFTNEYVTLMGIPSGTQNLGEFKVLHDQNIVLLDNSFTSDYIILEYIQSPTANGDFRVPVYLREALISWLSWMDIKSMAQSRRSNLGEKDMRKRRYFADRRIAKSKINRFRLTTANDVIRLNNRAAVKS